MKRVLSFILALMLALGLAVMPANAASKNTDLEKKLLTQLEIIPKSKADTSGLSRLELAQIIVKMINFENEIVLGAGETIYVDIPHTAEAAVVVNTVTQRGIMSGVGDGRFDPDSAVTLNQAICSVVNMLGYKNAALAEGAYPNGFLKIASGIGLLDGVNLSEETITIGNLKKLLANAMSANVMVMTGVGENQKYEILKDEPFMTYTMGLKKVSGVVRGTVLSAITEEAFTGYNEININGNVYGIGDFNANDYVGYYVDACFIDEDDSYLQEIVYIEIVKNKNKTLEILADEFRAWTGDEIVYAKNGSSKREKARIEDGADIMYNGTPLTIYNDDDFVLEDGIITMIDNNGNGSYDVVSLTEHSTVVVKSINFTKKTILDMFVAENALDLRNADEDSLKIVDTKGKEMTFDSIMIGDVITWYVDRTGENYTLIVAQDNALVGEVTAKDIDEGLVYIDGDEYRVSPEYLNRYDAELSYGRSGTFYFDYKDRLVGFDSGKGVTSEWMYGMLLKPVYDEDNDEYLIKILTQDGNTQYFSVAKNVRVDFVKVREEFMDNVIMNLSSGVVKFIINPADEIIKIDTLEPDTEEDSLTQIYSGTTNYKGMGTDSFSDILIMDTDTIVFVPKQGSETEYEIPAAGYFATDKSYTFTAYGKPDSKIAEVIVAGRSADSFQEKVGILSDIVATLNNDGEPRYRIKLRDVAEIGTEKTLWGTEDLTVSGVLRGDVVGYTQNASTKDVSAIRSIYSPQTGERSGFATIGSGISSGNIKYSMGKVAKIEKDDYMVVIDENATDLSGAYAVYKLSLWKSRGQLYRYDELAADKVIAANPSEVIDFETAGNDCSRVLWATNTGWPAGMVIFNVND